MYKIGLKSIFSETQRSKKKSQINESLIPLFEFCLGRADGSADRIKISYRMLKRIAFRWQLSDLSIQKSTKVQQQKSSKHLLVSLRCVTVSFYDCNSPEIGQNFTICHWKILQHKDNQPIWLTSIYDINKLEWWHMSKWHLGCFVYDLNVWWLLS